MVLAEDAASTWTDRKINETVLKESSEQLNLVKIIRKRQLKFIGRVMRRRKLENQVMTEKLKGEKGREERQKKNISVD